MSVVTAPSRRDTGRAGPTMAQQEERLAYALLAIPILIVLGLVIFPVIWNILLSFQRVRLIELQNINFLAFRPTLANYERVIGSRGFLTLLRTTLIYASVGTALPILLGLIAALLARDFFPGRNIWRGFMLFPYIAPVVAVAFVWRIMLNAQFGIINEWSADWFGAQRISYLGQRSIDLGLPGLHTFPLALSVVLLFQGWRYFPFSFLFFLARLQALPDDLYEAAEVDGASLTQRFWYITMPQLAGVMGTLIVLRFIWTFNKFDDIFLLTGGAAGTEVIPVKIYDWLFGRSDVGSAAALSIVLALILAVLLFIYFRWFFVQVEE
ncbi:MAG: sugar ABC transporter permease [Ardenticatenaceae bacterium]|nr:sugar ABC transporter permease [Ardenticatenaceae bacterium]HBY98439.1 sugar ABC transporter permease [Chloroflexota bacterium]